MVGAVKHYFVQKIIADIRAYPGTRLNEGVAHLVDANEYVTDLRKEITKDDFTLLAQIVTAEPGNLGTLALTLCKGIVRHPEVRAFIVGLWPPAPSASLRRQFGIVSRLLDIEDLDPAIHTQIYSFVKNKLRPFLDWLTPWLGGPDMVMTVCRARLEDPSYPASKHWLYLCCALGSSDKSGAAVLLAGYVASQNQFLGTVAKDMLTELPKLSPFETMPADDQDDVVIQYLAAKVIEDIRNEKKLDDDLTDSLDAAQYVVQLRSTATKADIDLLFSIVETQSESYGLLALTMLKNFVNRPEVETALREAWQRETRFRTKVGLAFRLLDLEVLEPAMHEDLYEFIKQNLGPFVAWLTVWAGGPDSVLPHCRRRLDNPAFPASKHWLYLCRLLGSPDKKAVAAILKSYESSSNAFNAKVAKEIMNELPRY